MGYTTDFDGRINFSRPLTVPEFNELKKFSEYMDRSQNPEGAPDAYCQWEPTPDGEGLQWDGGEKFYEYTAWLRWLADNWFKPKGIILNGTLRYQGEEIGDVGRIEVKDSVVTEVELEVTGIVECPECGERFVPSDTTN